jgi:hypothetical protein
MSPFFMGKKGGSATRGGRGSVDHHEEAARLLLIVDEGLLYVSVELHRVSVFQFDLPAAEFADKGTASDCDVGLRALRLDRQGGTAVAWDGVIENLHTPTHKGRG